MPSGSCKDRRLGGKYRLHHQGEKNRRARNVSTNWQPKHAGQILLSLLVTDNFPSSSILVALIMEAINSPETPVLTRATLRIIPEDGILHSYCRENLRSYIAP
jgi:hypothetical protein